MKPSGSEAFVLFSSFLLLTWALFVLFCISLGTIMVILNSLFGSLVP